MRATVVHSHTFLGASKHHSFINNPSFEPNLCHAPLSSWLVLITQRLASVYMAKAPLHCNACWSVAFGFRMRVKKIPYRLVKDKTIITKTNACLVTFGFLLQGKSAVTVLIKLMFAFGFLYRGRNTTCFSGLSQGGTLGRAPRSLYWSFTHTLW